MKKLFTPLVVLTAALFAWSPFLIVGAPAESTMGLIQKIFYYHVPSWIVMFTAIFLSGIASIVFLMKGNRAADRVAVSSAEIAILFGLIGLVTGPLWAKKAWGVWWQWDARLTMALLLETIFLGYLLIRKYGGPGSDKLSAAIAIFGMANVPFVYLSVNIWRTVHPKTSVVPELVKSAPLMFGPLLECTVAFFLLFIVLLTARMHLEAERTLLDDLYLADEDAA